MTIYEQLAAEGYIETAAGARARVSLGFKPLPSKPQPLAARRPHRVASISAYGKRIEVLALPQPPVTDPAHINFLYGAIADEDFPKLAWRRHYNRALMRRQQHLYYGATAGELQLREELQAYLLRRAGWHVRRIKSSSCMGHNRHSNFAPGFSWILAITW